MKKRPRFSFTLLALSFFFYHSARVVGPILMLTWIVYLWNKFNEHRKIILGFLITSLLAFFLVFSSAGLARYNQVKPPSQNIRSIFINYFSYFDPNFLTGDIAKPFRYTTSNVGIVTIPIFVTLLIGIYTIFRSNKNKILLLFLAIGPLPATLTLEDSPNLHRAFFMLPFLVIITAVGFYFLINKHKFIAKVLAVLIFLSFISFCLNYFNTQNNLAYKYRDPQIQELTSYLINNKNNYNKIYVTNEPDSPYPWFAFFNNVNPEKLNNALVKQQNGRWQLENIIWDNTKCPAGAAFFDAKKDKYLTNIMVVDNGACTIDFKKDHPEAKIIKEFSSNAQVNYRVWEYQPVKP